MEAHLASKNYGHSRLAITAGGQSASARARNEEECVLQRPWPRNEGPEKFLLATAALSKPSATGSFEPMARLTC